jgi:hypothetical protein
MSRSLPPLCSFLILLGLVYVASGVEPLNGSGINCARLVARRLQALVMPTAGLAITGSVVLVLQMCLTDPLIEFSQRGDGLVGQCEPVLVLSTGWM